MSMCLLTKEMWAGLSLIRCRRHTYRKEHRLEVSVHLLHLVNARFELRLINISLDLELLQTKRSEEREIM